jgi:small subunit ribosomal protein S8
MSFTDPVGDMLTRIRNGQRARKGKVASPHSRLRERVLDVLKKEGYIRDWRRIEPEPGKAQIEIELKYHEGQPVIQMVQRVSKPGRRVYSSIGELPRIANGLGISILSTPKGVLSDAEARAENVGGEVLCKVF